MRSTLLLAWRHLAHHAGQSALLAACVALAFLLPIAVARLVDVFGANLIARAEATPLVVGAPGSRYDLVLNALYFQGRVPRPTTRAEADAIAESGLALSIPLLVRHRAQDFPLVGTSHDYFAFRALDFAEGGPPLLLGEAVIGARVARELGVGVGGAVLTDQGSLYDLSLGYPLKLSVVGVLRESGSADDSAVLCDVKTAWIVEGIGHGHVAAEEESDARVLARKDGEVVLGAATLEYTEITPDNIGTFHFHGEAGDFPLTAILVVPHDAKGETILKGRYRVSETAQLLVPREVIDELLGFVLRLKTFFDANAVLVAFSTALFLVLLVLLTIRVRAREIETLSKLGCARLTVAKLLATELALVVSAGLLAAVALGTLVARILAYGLGVHG